MGTNNSYVLPSNIGSAGEYLSVPQNGNVLQWTAGQGGSGVNSIANTDANLSMTDNDGNVTINLAQTIAATTINASNRIGYCSYTKCNWSK